VKSTLFLACVVFLSSCTGVSRPSPEFPATEVGKSVQGQPIYAWVFGPEGALDEVETVLFFGVIHGNEPLGLTLLESLRDVLIARPELLAGRRVVIAPLTNPDGHSRGTRANSRGVDLNRNFPSASWKPGRRHGKAPASEPETRAIIDLFEAYRPSRILSVHAPLYCVNYDGPAEELAERLAAASGYPVKGNIGYPTPGSFGSWAGIDHGVPTVTLELRGDLRESEVWKEMGSAMIAFIRFETDDHVAK